MLIILAGISLNTVVGEHGIIQKARKAGEATQRAQVQEEIELALIDLQMEKIEAGEEVTGEDIKNALEKNLSGIVIQEIYGNYLYGEYKKFSFIIKDNIVTLHEKRISGNAPILQFVNLNEIGASEEKDDVELKVVGEISEGSSGTIEKIEVLENANIEFMKDDKRNSEYGSSSVSRIYKVTDNGTYHFVVTASNGRIFSREIEITNATPTRKDLLTGISEINEYGYKRIKVKGKTTEIDKTKEKEEEQIYTLKVIYLEGDYTLGNGLKNTKTNSTETLPKGLRKSENTWYVGETEDINTNTVVLKIKGNLTLENGYTLTSEVNETSASVAKGLFIYCTGTLTINGTVNMSLVRCDAVSQNVYLWKNSDGSFEYIRENGGEGGAIKADGKGYGYSITSTSGSGQTTTTNDTHWITGGGAGGRDYLTDNKNIRNWSEKRISWHELDWRNWWWM